MPQRYFMLLDIEQDGNSTTSPPPWAYVAFRGGSPMQVFRGWSRHGTKRRFRASSQQAAHTDDGHSGEQRERCSVVLSVIFTIHEQ